MNKNIKKILVLIGNPNRVTTRGGQPFFFLKAGKRLGFFTSGLELNPEKLKLHRILWNLGQIIKTGDRGGFQYSDFFLRRLIKQADLEDSDLEFISYFPLLPPSDWKEKWTINYYIDATLKQNFYDYNLRNIVSKQIQDKALKQEYKYYHAAERIVCRSRWAASSVIHDYDVDPKKVHIILPGASIDEDLLDQTEILSSPPLAPLRLGFVGVDWRRKRLPFLLQVAESIKKRNIAVEVIVVGPHPKDLPSHPLIKPIGFVNKQTQMKDFIKLVQSFHFGCLFSTVEGQGQSILESLRLGVPVLGANASGIPDGVPKDLGFLFDLDASPSLVADLLEGFVQNPSTYYTLRNRVSARADEFSWQQTVHNFKQVWQGSKDFCYDAIAIR